MSADRSLPAPNHTNQLQEHLRRLDREQGDAMCGVIARRMYAAEHPPAPAERAPAPIIEAPARMSVVNSDGARLLTPRQEQVVALVADGLCNREIARELKLSEHTVKKYLYHIFEKLGISTRVELVLYAVNHNSGNEHRQADECPPPAVRERLLERAAAFLDELLIDNRLDADQIAEAKTLLDDIMTACKKPVASVASVASVESGPLRAQGVGGYQRERKRTQVFLQPLGLPVWKDGKRCLCAVIEHFVLNHPRENEKLVWWFETVELARQNFPEARLLALPDYKAAPAPAAFPIRLLAQPDSQPKAGGRA
jgi:DNA-binding CsgD family transcriptional regulator